MLATQERFVDGRWSMARVELTSIHFLNLLAALAQCNPNFANAAGWGGGGKALLMHMFSAAWPLAWPIYLAAAAFVGPPEATLVLYRPPCAGFFLG